MNARQWASAWLLASLLTFSGVACTSTTKNERPGSSPDTEQACFNAHRVRSFSPLHERFVYVRARGDEHYLLTMDAVCMGLPFATAITISGTYSRVCSDTGAMITYLNSGRSASCRIIRVEAVASKEAAQELVTARTTPRPRG